MTTIVGESIPRIDAAGKVTGETLYAADIHLPGKKPKISYLSTYPSYLGMLVETGLRQGLGPRDFGLERIAAAGILPGTSPELAVLTTK